MASSLRDFILYTTENYYSLPKLKVDDRSEQALSDFIHSSQTLLLQGVMNGNSATFHTKICSDNRSQSIIFYKTSAQDLTGDNSAKILNITTLSANVAETLYQSLKQIYTPLLATYDDVYSNKLQKNLSELESHLRILSHGKGEGNINVILSVEDEVEYWKTFGRKCDSSNKERETSSTMCEIFEDVCDEIRSMQSTNMADTREIVENIGGLLDDVWRFTTIPYSQDRMIHIFDIIGHNICSIIQKACFNLELWKVNNGNKENSLILFLSESLAVIQTWISACESLTGTYWPNYALHAWNGKTYIPPFCVTFQTRLKQISEIRSTYCQLNKLLTNAEKTELKTHQLFEPFENINVWACNGQNNVWAEAVSRFSIALRPAETKIAEKLRPRLHNTSTRQMLYEFIRYKLLIERPIVKQALNTELEIFVSSLTSLVKSIQNQLQADEMDVRMYQPPEMSRLVQQLQWAKQMEAKVKDIQLCAEQHLKEFEGSVELSKLSAQVLKDLKAMYTQLHEEWCRDLQAQVKNGSLQLSMDKPVVEFSSESRLMVVNFNPRLVWWSLEARALAALGLPPPPAAAALDALSAALEHASALQQIASFHNTLGERMIPSTRPMMLQAALDLSTLVQDQKAVYWDDVEQIANYTNKLKTQVLKLETQNSYLTGQHLAIRNIVETLLDTELITQQSEWKKLIKDIRDIIENVEANGYKNTDAWRTHWDWQIYKVLECQYIKTLLSLHKHFPHVKVDLVLRGQSVRVQPPLEEIRVSHYHQLRRLCALPAHVATLRRDGSGDLDLANIVHNHSWLANKAVQQLEATLRSLQQTSAHWSRRAALACAPALAPLCARLALPHHWEDNFKACKAYGQAVAKMTFEDEKIEWITVGTASLRRELESSSRALWANLMSSLQASCRSDASKLDEFVAAASLLLRDKQMPKNAKELSELSAQQQALQANMPEIEKTVECLKRKGHMLRTWGGDASIDGSIREWNKTRDLMASQQQMFEHQAEIVKTGLSGEWENLSNTVEAFASRWEQNKTRLWDADADADADGVEYGAVSRRCRSVLLALQRWRTLLAHRELLLQECEKFNMKIEPSAVWEDAEKLMNEYVSLWTPFKEYSEEYESISEQEWIVFQKKLHLLDEFANKWAARLDPYTAVTLFIRQELDKFADLTPILKYLRGSEFTEFHWRDVFNLLEMEYKKPDTLVLRDLLGVAPNIKKHVKALQKISANASSEAAIRSALNDLELWFASARVSITYYSDHDKRPTPIVKDFKDILAKIEEQQWIVSSVSAGGAGAEWEARLRAARALAAAAHHAQRRWLYLEPILCNDEGVLGTKFRKVDQGFRQVARIFEADPRLSALLQSSRLQSMLDSISEQLVSCQSALNQYIDEKRSIFPRLYFLSDDDLLELLGQARAGAEGREVVMQTHLKKLFPGTTGVRLGPGGMSITALCSHFDETFQLDHPVDIDCPVEIWLKNLETEMRSSLKNITLKCVLTSSVQDQDPFSLPPQILCLAQNIRFTEQAEKAIASKDLHKLKANVEKENSYYASTEADDESERHKRQALILQCAYYISVIAALIENNVVSTNDWLWQKQLRFYLLSNKEVVAKMGLAEISYSYEYLGVNTGQFVRTELADECFLILTQSLHLGLVGNPFGPAGTGKTESVKALGGLVGRLVLVFNCDEAMDAECMGRLLSGLALCGAWGCFDEFNRLAADTLAAVSHQLACLLPAMQRSVAGRPATALLNGKQVEVNAWCGVAATMNPAGRGYGGRRQLSAALQRALRPVAMSAPAPRPLAASLLRARALPDAEELASLLCDVFSLASELLSGQRHYDWGLRALKAAVNSCGAALAAARGAGRAEQKLLLRRLLALNNVSKLSPHDADRFEDILSLVFGESKDEKSTDDPLKIALEQSVETLGLQRNEIQIQKCIQLYEQLQQRMGVAIVGPPGSGKTTIRKLLKAALTRQGRTIVEYVIGPKAMSRDSLLGHIDRDTRQWADGVISATALEISNQAAAVWSWVVLDGDIDPEWVEALNSVLDDNRLLTLPSGARLQLSTGVNFLFETHELSHASPATISRLGIVLLSDKNGCAEEALESILRGKDFEDDTVKMAVPLLQQVVKKCLQWFDSHRSDVVLKICNTTMVKQMVTQFTFASQNSPSPVTPEELVQVAVQRSVAGLLKAKAVDSFFDQACSDIGGTVGMQDSITRATISMESYTWYGAVLMSPRLSATEPILRAALDVGQHLIVVGPHACGKNLLIEHVLKETDSTVITITCTPITDPTDIIAELKRHNVVRTGAVAGGGARCVLVLQALHRALADHWGSQPLLQFLLQLIQSGGFWSVGGVESGAVWCGAAVRLLASAGAAPSAPRLAALSTLVLPEPDDDELMELTKTSLFNNIDKNMKDKEITSLVPKIVAMFKEVTETFHSRPHYKWDTSHLMRWCENVKYYSPSNLAELSLALIAEANSIFKDRLVSDEERSTFASICRHHLKDSSDIMYFNTKQRDNGVYLDMTDREDWYQRTQKIINQCLSEDELAFGAIGAEVCLELSVLSTAMARATSGGVVTCVGSAGAGRRAAARLACAALSAHLFVIESAQQFYLQFKNATTVASEGRRALVLVSESCAESASLSRIEALRRAVDPRAAPLAPPQLSAAALQQIKQYLGIVICLDKSQEDLWDLMKKFPWLHTEHVVWTEGWCPDTIREMPGLIIDRLMKEDVSQSKEQSDPVPVDGFVNIYKSIENEEMRAPYKYVRFVKTYYHILNKKKHALLQRQTILSAGVEALRRARASVATLQEEAAAQRSALSQRQAAAAAALDQMAATVRHDSAKKDDMTALRATITRENHNLQIRKKEIEAELASVEPVIEAARSAVGDIKPESLSEVRSLRAPPDVVRDILEGVLRLMGIADTSWHSMKNFLSKRGVKEDIRCLDASQIKPEAAAAVSKLLEKRGHSFEPSVAKRASAACAPLAAWVRANLAYAAALARVQPLLLQQRALQRNLQEAEAQLAALSSGLESVTERVDALKQQLGTETREAAAIELRLEAATATIAAAEGLLDRLADEDTAWGKHLEHISKEIGELTLRSLLAAAYLIYLPHLTEPQAKEYISKWSSLISFADTSFSVINFLSTVEMQLKWEADGLPADETAIKNAVVITQALEQPACGLTPLLLDPDGDALRWLCRSLDSHELVAHSAHNFSTAAQYAQRLNRPLVVTGVRSWSAALDGARLALQCEQPPSLPPRFAAQVAMVNFAARLDPLTDRLVNHALQQQNPEMNEKCKEIKIQKATLQKQQYELQENLLRELSTKIDILHDANLLESLKQTRATAVTIKEALQAAADLQRSSSAAAAKYCSSARRAAALALRVRRLAAARALLALPLQPVLDLYVDAVRHAESKDTKDVNTEEVVKYFTRRIIERVLLALHKKDKYTVVIYLLKEVYEEDFPEKLWQLFLGNVTITDDDKDIINKIEKSYSWIPEECIKNIAQIMLTSKVLFKKLNLDDKALWQNFIESGDLSSLGRLGLTPLETALAASALRPDSRYRALVALVDHYLGSSVMRSSDVIQTAARLARTRRVVLALGAHALDALVAHARALTMINVSEGAAAWEAAVERCRRGGWLCVVAGAAALGDQLQNFVLEVTQRPPEDFNDDFRLWIVSEDSQVPAVLSNVCINVILEAPEGVKRNVVGTLCAWGEYSAEPALVRMHACLALFHALAQERRAYIPQGWSQWYSWEWGEVSTCAALSRSCWARLGREGARALTQTLYSARVPAARDRVLLRALAAACLADAAFAHDWRPRGLPLKLPLTNELHTYVSAFEGLPDIDTPQLLGLPANCRVAWERTAADDIIMGLKEFDTIADTSKITGGPSPVASLRSLWKKLMSGNPLIKEDYQIKDVGGGWWGSVAAGEALSAAAVARTLHATLSRESVLYTVPAEWQTLWSGPASPAAYIREFCERARAALQRMRDVERGDQLPKELDLRQFLRPSRAVWSLRARAAATLARAPRDLVLCASWDSAAEDDVSAGVRVVGLRLSGAVWGGGALGPARAHHAPHARAPALLLRYLPQSSESPLAPEGTVDVPVYTNEAREELICSARAPLAGDFPRDTALLNAVALFVAPLD
ncbi:cytoplasmic dynein 2 heavy chain 1 [Plodia interpunctella]|uniref:cytoplasmic dynein 2 heavy chain 1 n=1 Tax=Plodia interpunctella TaxID=58824 RepID=UPI0023676A57|nr:cytoplasmic dynein 2 heavy chain 1 [Plodia interpunctella]